MKKHAQEAPVFVVCICNEGYEASLELHKIYRKLQDERVGGDEDIRVVDESGEDYIYPASCFTPIEPPAAAVKSLLRAS
jgi:hypothetical protein